MLSPLDSGACPVAKCNGCPGNRWAWADLCESCRKKADRREREDAGLPDPDPPPYPSKPARKGRREP